MGAFESLKTGTIKMHVLDRSLNEFYDALLEVVSHQPDAILDAPLVHTLMSALKLKIASDVVADANPNAGAVKVRVVDRAGPESLS